MIRRQEDIVVWFCHKPSHWAVYIYTYYSVGVDLFLVNVVFDLNEVLITDLFHIIPDSKVHGANMGPTWGRQDPVGPHVGPMDLAIWDAYRKREITITALKRKCCLFDEILKWQRPNERTTVFMFQWAHAMNNAHCLYLVVSQACTGCKWHKIHENIDKKATTWGKCFGLYCTDGSSSTTFDETVSICFYGDDWLYQAMLKISVH